MKVIVAAFEAFERTSLDMFDEINLNTASNYTKLFNLWTLVNYAA